MPIDSYYYGVPVQDSPDIEEDGYLSKLAHTVLSPLSWLASTIDKPGRTVRSLLGGEGASSLLNLIPFSDTMGITDPDQAPTGRDLLRKWGMADQEDSWGNWLGGLGLEVLTDPLNAMTFGTKSTLTALGRDALKAGELAGTAGGRIAAGQSGLIGLRTPWFMDMLGAQGRLPLMTGQAGEATANWLGRTGDYLMHEAPVISGPLSKLESMFRYGAGWTGDRRYVQGSGGALDAEKAVINAAAQPMTELVSTKRDAIERLTNLGVPAEQANDYFNRAVVGAKEMGFPETPYLREIAAGEYGPAAQVARQNVAQDLMRDAGTAAGQLGDTYDIVRQNLRSLGVKVGEDPALYDLGYFHRQALEGTMRKGSQQTGRSLAAEVFPGGTNQINDYIANPNFTGLRSQQMPPGVTPSQWSATVDQQVASNAESIFANAKAHRDNLFQQYQQMGGVPAEKVDALTDDILRKKSRDMAEFFADVKPEVAAEGTYYRNDPISSAFEYISNLSRQAGTAKSNLATLARQAMPAAETLQKAANPSEFVNLKQAMQDIDQTAVEHVPGSPSQIEYGGKKSLLEELENAGKTNAITPGWQGPVHSGLTDTILENQVVPKDLIDVIKREIAGPGYESKYGFGEMVDKLTSYFRTGVTLPFPAYHARNLWEGVLQQGLGGGLSPKGLSDVAQYLSGTVKDPALLKELAQYQAEAFSHGAAFRNQAMHLLGESAVGNPNANLKPWITQGEVGVTEAITNRFKPKEGENYLQTLLDAGVSTHNDVDNMSRFGQFVGLRRQGYSPSAATEIVTNSQLDYSRLTPAERKLRQLIPFYSFSRGNIERLATQAQDPGALASLLRASTDAGQEGYVPNYVSPGAAIALPGETDEGKTRYLSGFSLPFEDEITGSLASLAMGDVTGAARRAFSSANPLMKLAATLATNRQLYSGRSLDEVTPSPITSLGGLIPTGAANVASETLSATPIGRLLSTVNAGIAGKDQNLLLKLLTGIKTTDVDQQAATQMAARDAIRQALLSTGMVSTSQNYFPKQEYRDESVQPEGFQHLLQLMAIMDQQAKAAAASRMSNQPLP